MTDAHPVCPDPYSPACPGPSLPALPFPPLPLLQPKVRRERFENYEEEFIDDTEIITATRNRRLRTKETGFWVNKVCDVQGEHAGSGPRRQACGSTSSCPLGSQGPPLFRLRKDRTGGPSQAGQKGQQQRKLPAVLCSWLNKHVMGQLQSTPCVRARRKHSSGSAAS